MAHFSTSLRIINLITFLLVFGSMHLYVRAQIGCTNTTTAITSITTNSAVSGGNVCSSSIGSITSRGLCWSTSPSPVPGQSGTSKVQSGSGTGLFTATMTGLSPGTRYYVRSYAVPTKGYIYGNEVTFFTPVGTVATVTVPPAGSTVTIPPPGSITGLNCEQSAYNGRLTVGVEANSVSFVVPYSGGNGGAYAAQKISSRRVIGLKATLASGTFLNGSGSLSFIITGIPVVDSSDEVALFDLNIGGKTCTVQFRVNVGAPASCGATNVHNPVLIYGSMTDQDGNVYKTINIGTQTWMAENLKARRYRNGDVIRLATDNASWGTSNTGATCWPSIDDNNDSASYNCPYGKLYNWFAVNDARNICPTGWHVPTDAEFTTLDNFLGVQSFPGKKMKSPGTQYWFRPTGREILVDNTSGFSGLPGGYRYWNGTFYGFSRDGFWWSSTESNASNAWCRKLNYESGFAERNNLIKQSGISVRCVKD